MGNGGGGHTRPKIFITEDVRVEWMDASLCKCLANELWCDHFAGFHILLDDIVAGDCFATIDEVTVRTTVLWGSPPDGPRVE